MKRYLCVLLALLAVLFCGCDREEAPETTVPETTVPETTAPVARIDFSDYEYRYTDQRDREWEEDIVYMTQIFLGDDIVDGHPYLTHNDVSINSMFDYDVEFRSLFDQAKYDRFVEDISALIGNIPNLTDIQIHYELARIVNELEDLHASAELPMGELFPFAVERLESDGELGFYIVRLPKKYQKLIFSRLVSINDVPVEEVFERMKPYLCGESDEGAMALFTNVLYGNYIAWKDALQVIGVMGWEEDTVRLGLVTPSGAQARIELEALDYETEYDSSKIVDNCHVRSEGLSWSKYFEADFFYEYLEEEDTLYIRLYTVPSYTSGELMGFISGIKKLVQEREGVSKTIVDFRDNGGGVTDTIQELLEFLNDPITGHKYVLINESSFSAAVLTPYWISISNEDTTLVGTPASQRPNTPSVNGQLWKLKNRDKYFKISMGYMELAPDYENDTLIPDILVYQTLEDYIEDIDTVLETVLDME